ASRKEVVLCSPGPILTNPSETLHPKGVDPECISFVRTALLLLPVGDCYPGIFPAGILLFLFVSLFPVIAWYRVIHFTPMIMTFFKRCYTRRSKTIDILAVCKKIFKFDHSVR